VKIGHAFAAGKYAVTFEEWDECVALKGGCPDKISDSNWGRGRQPVISVSWEEAEKYVAWLSLMTGKDYRLLSEAEWEYAARARTSTAYSFGDNYPPSKKICEYANFADISLKKAAPTFQTSDICDDGHSVPAPQVSGSVEDFKPNGFGLYHMHGNVFQWTEDCYVKSYENAPIDGSSFTTEGCNLRVARGGSWFITPVNLRSAFRGRFTPGYRSRLSRFPCRQDA
jgi:formylglycine-generating enzyme required for sulfatase activity